MSHETLTSRSGRTGVAASDPLGRWPERVAEADWARIRRDLDEYGGALIGPLVTPEEAARIASLYTDDTRFRSTVNIGRRRFGEGEYRYFAEPLPDPIIELKRARAALAAGGYLAHRVFFADEQTAIAAGYRPCAVCLPAAHQAWKLTLP